MSVQDRTMRDHVDVESTANWLQEIGLAGTAYMLLQGFRPLSFIGGQSLLFLQPLLPWAPWRSTAGRLAAVLVDRSQSEALLAALEARLHGSVGSRGKKEEV